jgi:hypothetical protein
VIGIAALLLIKKSLASDSNFHGRIYKLELILARISTIQNSKKKKKKLNNSELATLQIQTRMDICIESGKHRKKKKKIFNTKNPEDVQEKILN